MEDPYGGQAGTFIVDPDKGVRVPIEQYRAEQALKAQVDAARQKPKTKQEPELKTEPEPEAE
jgi:hypothetical protein